MISRVWHGWTRPESADAYEALLRRTILPGIERQGIDGYQGCYLYRRDGEGEVEFVTTLLFDSLDAVRRFAGEEYEVAVIHPEAQALLSHFDPRSAHYTVVLRPGDLASAGGDPPPRG
jgi:heme-degrading monooxygenase HmoA